MVPGGSDGGRGHRAARGRGAAGRGLAAAAAAAARGVRGALRVPTGRRLELARLRRVPELPALALGKDDEFHAAKLATARFYFAWLLPETAHQFRAARAGAASLMAIAAEDF